MKKIYLSMLPILLLTSCAIRKYTYQFKMTHPVESKRLDYENDTFSIVYDIDSKKINFTLYNKSEDGLKINWDEVSISLNGKAYRILHKETGTLKINDVQPPTTIPPKAVLEDFLVPSNSVRTVSSYYSFTVIYDIFPKYDKGSKKLRNEIMNFKGQRITIFFPFFIKGIYVSHYYDLMISDVVASR